MATTLATDAAKVTAANPETSPVSFFSLENNRPLASDTITNVNQWNRAIAVH